MTGSTDWPADWSDTHVEILRQAREMIPGERMLAGCRMFAKIWAALRAGMREQFPGLDGDEIDAIIRERVGIVMEVDERNPGLGPTLTW